MSLTFRKRIVVCSRLVYFIHMYTRQRLLFETIIEVK